MQSNNQSKADDRYLRFSLANPARVAGVIREFLPKELVQTLDLSQLRRIHDQHIQENLKELRDDLNLQCPLLRGGHVIIRILMEHKSHHAPDLWLQLIRSICTIWEIEKISPVIPIVVHTGEKPFRFDTPQKRLRKLPSILTQGLPNFQIQAIDLNQIHMNRILQSQNLDSYAKFSLAILKLSQQKNLQIQAIKALVHSLWPTLSKASQRRHIEASFYYLSLKSTLPKESIQNLRSIMPLVHPINPKSAFAQELREEHAKGLSEGMEKGLSQGIIEGLERDKVEVIQGMLAKGFDWQTIQDITHLDQSGYDSLRFKYSTK